jgi:hypothetical protein
MTFNQVGHATVVYVLDALKILWGLFPLMLEAIEVEDSL